MQTCRSRNTRRAARSLLAENEVTHTRSQAPVRRSTAASGSGGVLRWLDPHVRPGSQQVFQQRDRLGAVDERGGDLPVVHPGDPARLAGHPGQGPVVEGDQHPVQDRSPGRRSPVSIAQPDGVLEGLPRVLRGVRWPPAVRKRNRPGVVKEYAVGMPQICARPAEQAVNGCVTTNPRTAGARGFSSRPDQRGLAGLLTTPGGMPGPAQCRRRRTPFSDPTRPTSGMYGSASATASRAGEQPWSSLPSTRQTSPCSEGPRAAGTPRPPARSRPPAPARPRRRSSRNASSAACCCSSTRRRPGSAAPG